MMRRHNDSRINYANSAPTPDHIHINTSSTTHYDIPDYKYRRMYKIDWKVCFLQWSKSNGLIDTVFHAFIEDDSYVCTSHVLYQANVYQSYHTIQKRPFRTGTKLWSGYDDSFTLLSSEVADTFATHYPSNGFNCSHIIDTNAIDVLDQSMWLSWGNSWIHERCNWTNALRDVFNMTIIEPSMDCFQSVFYFNKSMKYNDVNPYDHHVPLDYPCSKEPLVLHHAHAFKFLILNFDRKKQSSICDRMMFIDKIKEPMAIKFLWNITKRNNNNYINFTSVFTNDGAEGWKRLLDDYKRSKEHSRGL